MNHDTGRMSFQRSVRHFLFGDKRLTLLEAGEASDTSEHLTLGLFQEQEILVTRDAGSPKIIHDDEDRHRAVAGDHDRPRDAGFGIDAMVAFFTDQDKPRELKDTTQALIGDWDNARHRDSIALERHLHVLRGKQGGRTPPRTRGITGDKAFFAQDVLERAHPLAFFQEQTDRFREATTSLLERVATTGDAQLRTVADERLSFLENQRSELNLVHRTFKYSCSTPFGQRAGV